MQRPFGGSDGRARLGVVLRAAGMVLGVALTMVAIWLIVTGDTQKRLRIGVLVGLWGLLLAAYSIIGARRQDVAEAGGELVVRGRTGLDTLTDAAAMREYEHRLQVMLRREIEQTLGAELAALRAEVASLRQDVIDKVGPELMLERIETTRVIGSDIEALQREVSQLKSTGFPREAIEAEFVAADEPPAPRPRPVPEPAPFAATDAGGADAHAAATSRWDRPEPATPGVAPPVPVASASPVADMVAERRAEEPAVKPAADAVPAAADGRPPYASADGIPSSPYRPATAFAPPDPEPDPAPETSPEPARESLPYPAPAPAPEPVREPAPYPAPDFSPAPVPAAARPEPQPVPEPAPVAEPASADPFASLPRIRPFTEFDLDPIEPAAAVPLPPPPPPSARQPVDEPVAREGGRRRRENAEDDDVLQRILQRERQNG